MSDEQKKMRININTKDVPEKRKRFKIRNKKTKAIVKEKRIGHGRNREYKG